MPNFTQTLVGTLGRYLKFKISEILTLSHLFAIVTLTERKDCLKSLRCTHTVNTFELYQITYRNKFIVTLKNIMIEENEDIKRSKEYHTFSKFIGMIKWTVKFFRCIIHSHTQNKVPITFLPLTI